MQVQTLLLVLKMIFEVQEKISQTFLYYTHIVPRLQCLYQRWCLLDKKEKLYIDYEVLNSLEIKGRILFKALRDAFVQWDIIQDTEGASGFYPAALDRKYGQDIESEISNVLNIFELVLHRLDNYKNSNSLDNLQSQKFNLVEENDSDSISEL